MKKKKLLIADFNRTLYDPENEMLFDGVAELLKKLRENTFVVVVATKVEGLRGEKIAKSGLEEMTDAILNLKEKTPENFRQIAEDYLDQYEKDSVWVVGDVLGSEIAAGIENDFHTVWLRKGKFSERGVGYIHPRHTITDIRDLWTLLEKEGAL